MEFNIKKNDITLLREVFTKYEQSQEAVKPNIYYIRGDMAYIVRGIFRKYVYTKRLSRLPKYEFFDSGLQRKYNLVDVQLPEHFPKDCEIFMDFQFEKME